MDATYRADLKQMNDLNFARFDAKMGERLAELESRLEIKTERRFAALEVRLSRRIYVVSTASFFAQLAALITLFKVFAPR